MGRGRPREEPKTAIKLHSDLVAMVFAIANHEGIHSYQIIEPLIREQIEKQYRNILPALQKAAKASPAARKLLDEAAAAIDAAKRFHEEEAAKRKAAE